MAAGDLCTLADVRAAMEIAVSDTSLDARTSDLITTASRECCDHAQREFAPATGNATRRFDVRGRHVDLAPYDLRAATAVTFDPDATAVVLTQHTDYEPLPVGGDKDGLITEVRLSYYLSLATTKFMSFGHADLAIAGSWGFAAVPGPVKEACIIAVRSWLRRDLQTFAGAVELGGTPSQQPQVFGTYKLPAASRDKLHDYRRYP